MILCDDVVYTAMDTYDAVYSAMYTYDIVHTAMYTYRRCVHSNVYL